MARFRTDHFDHCGDKPVGIARDNMTKPVGKDNLQARRSHKVAASRRQGHGHGHRDCRPPAVADSTER